MKKKFGIVLIVCLAILGVICGAPEKVSAATSSSKVTYTLKKGTLIIKGKGKMPKSMTFKNNKKIKSVIIRKGITSIPTKAFYKCSNLSKVTIAGTVKTIGNNAFAGTGIKSLKIPKKVTKIGYNALGNCEKLTKITLPGNFTMKGEKSFRI